MVSEQTEEPRTMPEAHEELEQAEHTEHAAGINKKVALLIAIMALFLAFSETLGKSANTEAINLNVLASDTWAFFQAKTIRRTTLSTAIEEMTVDALTASDAAKPAIAKQIAEWQKTVDRYRSDPQTREGTAELMVRAQEAEHERDTALARYHNYEIASAAFQIGIVLCSAAVITATIWLAFVASGVAVLGAVFMALGLFAPHALHLA
jgi:ABC-type nickel/cobalt efflux system permease component RcnA